jgi:biotin transport system substrate-specific component
LPQTRPFNATVRLTLAVGALILATAVAAQIRIPLPFTPVPITLQTAVVMLGALLLPRPCGALAQALYLAVGTFGLPVFAGAAWLTPYLLGPTGGYLLGFVAMSLYLGIAVQRRPRPTVPTVLVHLLLAQVLLFAVGLAHLKYWTQGSWSQAFTLGLYPFLPGAAVKTAAVVALHRRLHAWALRTF